MMKLNRFALLLGIASISLYSCNRDKDDETSCVPPAEFDTLTINFSATTAGVPMEHLKEFQDPLGRKLQVELMQFYVSNIRFIGPNVYQDSEVYLPKLVNQGDVTKTSIKVPVPVGNYTGIELGIGLDAATNASDPSEYADDHPLSVYEATYWTSWDSYIFSKFEGKFEKDGDGIIDDIFAYHPGFDECYRTSSFSKDFEIQKDGLNEMEFTFEYNEVFFGADTLDMGVIPTWHGDKNSMDVANGIADRFSTALKLK